PGEGRDPCQAHTMRAWVYIMTNKAFGTLYIGMTADLMRRIWEHKHGMIDGFTKKYGLHHLVYYECHDALENAAMREKQLTEWKRNWKLRLIMDMNPNWNDLYNDFVYSQAADMGPGLRRDLQ
ncbi:MAG: GIY-YIG nuclease family protein, partial [Bacteroidota bacterium]